jgi:hypothetical protein
VRVNRKFLAVLALGLASIVALPSVAAAQGTTVGLSYDLLYREYEENSALGAHFDVGRGVTTFGTMGMDVLGEIGFNNFESGTVTSFGGGVRFRPASSGQVSFVIPVLIGIWHFSDFNDLFFQPGVGFEYAWSEKVNIIGGFDYRRIFDDFDGGNGVRISIGVRLPVGQ